MTPVNLQFGGYLGEYRARRLMKAIQTGNNARAEKLLDKGLSVDQVTLKANTGPISSVLGNEYGYPFVEALRAKNFELAQVMMERFGARLDQMVRTYIGPVGLSPVTLMDRVLHMDPAVLDFALKHGMDPDTPSRLNFAHGLRPVEVVAAAFKYENENTLKQLELLLDAGVEVDLAALIETVKKENWTTGKPQTVAFLEARLARQTHEAPQEPQPESKPKGNTIL